MALTYTRRSKKATYGLHEAHSSGEEVILPTRGLFVLLATRQEVSGSPPHFQRNLIASAGLFQGILEALIHMSS